MTIGFDEDLPNDVYHYNEMRKNMNWQKTGVASLLKPAPVTQHLPSFDAEGKPCFKPYRGSGKLEGKYALITGNIYIYISFFFIILLLILVS